MAQSGPLPLDWEVVTPIGPELAHHTGCIINNSFYIHGGITKYGNNIPSDKLYRLDFSTGIWNEVRDDGCPALSHHCCVALHNRYMLLIGGWNGKQRTSKVYAYDTAAEKWLFPTDTGFRDGAGLSSHTATLLSSGEILVIGREGSLRIQKKHGSVFVLTGDVEKGAFRYTPYTSETASRSGHTTNIIGNTVFIIGGRDDMFVEAHDGYRTNMLSGSIATGLSKITDVLKSLPKPPSARKNHVTVSAHGALLIHGGDTFDGKNREPVGEMFVMTTKPVTFFQVGNSRVKRCCHVCCSDSNRVLIHGGVSGRGKLYGDCHELKIHPQLQPSISKQKN